MLLIPDGLRNLPEQDRFKWEIIAKGTALLVVGGLTVDFFILTG